MSDKALTKLRRRHIGFVFQSFNLLPTLTAEENVLLPLTIAGRKAAARDARRADRARRPRRAPSPPPVASSPAASSSASPSPARWSPQPTVLFADEPTGNLDSTAGAEVLELLREAVDLDGQTTVMVTHDPRAAARADRVLFLADGRIVVRPRPADRGRRPGAHEGRERLMLRSRSRAAGPPPPHRA